MDIRHKICHIYYKNADFESIFSQKDSLYYCCMCAKFSSTCKIIFIFFLHFVLSFMGQLFMDDPIPKYTNKWFYLSFVKFGHAKRQKRPPPSSWMIGKCFFLFFTRCARYARKISTDDDMCETFVSQEMQRGHPHRSIAKIWAQSEHGEPSFDPPNSALVFERWKCWNWRIPTSEI